MTATATNGSGTLDLIEVIAERAAELVAERSFPPEGKSDGWLRGADKIADYIDAPRSRVYALAACNPGALELGERLGLLLTRQPGHGCFVTRLLRGRGSTAHRVGEGASPAPAASDRERRRL